MDHYTAKKKTAFNYHVAQCDSKTFKTIQTIKKQLLLELACNYIKNTNYKPKNNMQSGEGACGSLIQTAG